MSAICEEVQGDNVPRSRHANGSQASGLKYHSCVRDCCLLQDGFDDADKTCVKEVSHPPVRAPDHVAFERLLLSRMDPTHGTVLHRCESVPT